MRAISYVLLGVVAVAVILAGAGLAYLKVTGLSTRGEPGSIEATIARVARSLAIPSSARTLQNPVSVSPDVIAEGQSARINRFEIVPP